MDKKNLSIALIALIMPTVFVLCYFVFFTNPPVNKIFYGTSRAFFVLMPILWYLLADKKKFPFPRLKQDGIDAGIVSGICIGLVALVLYIKFFQHILPVGEIQEKAKELGFGGNMFVYFAFFIIMMNSSLEEYYWRWFGFSKLKAVFKPGKAIFLSGLGFMSHHVVILVIFFGWGWGSFFGFCVGIGGWLWAYFYNKYDSIWPGWISHAIIDAAVMLIGFDMLFCQ